MLIVQHDYDVPHYQKLRLQLFSTDSKQQVAEQEINRPFDGDAVRVFQSWAKQFEQPIFGLHFGSGFTELASFSKAEPSPS